MIRIAAGSDAALLPDCGGWTTAPGTRLPLRLPAGAGRPVLEIALDPQLAPPRTRHRRVSLALGGIGTDALVLGRRRLSGAFLWQVGLPERLPQSAELILTDEDFTPAEPRGVRLAGWRFLRDSSPPLPAPRRARSCISFGWNETSEYLLGDGFGAPEDAYSWAFGPESVLRLPVPGDGAPLLALLERSPFLDARAPAQRITVSAEPGTRCDLTLSARTTVAVDIWPRAGETDITLRFRNHAGGFAPLGRVRSALAHHGARPHAGQRRTPGLRRLPRLAGAGGRQPAH